MPVYGICIRLDGDGLLPLFTFTATDQDLLLRCNLEDSFNFHIRNPPSSEVDFHT